MRAEFVELELLGKDLFSNDVLVKLNSEAQRNAESGIPAGPLRRLAESPPKRLGIESIDDILRQLKAASVVKLHAAPLAGASKFHLERRAKGVDTTYRFQFESPSQAAEALNRLEQLDAIEVASLTSGCNRVVPSAAAHCELCKNLQQRGSKQIFRWDGWPPGMRIQLLKVSCICSKARSTIVRMSRSGWLLGTVVPGKCS